MLNEFVERVLVHEGVGRGKIRRQRVDIHLNFIGAFELPADFITPMEIEEQRQREKEQWENDRLISERTRERYERRKQEKREFTARLQAGLLTPEELEAHEQRKAHSRAWQKEWREKRKAIMPPNPPKPPKQPSKRSIIQAIVDRKNEGISLTPEETEIYAAYREKENTKARKRRERIKANTPPKLPKPKPPTKKERMHDIAHGLERGLLLQPKKPKHTPCIVKNATQHTQNGVIPKPQATPKGLLLQIFKNA